MFIDFAIQVSHDILQGWGGMVSGKNPVKSLLMDGFQSVGAVFSQPTLTEIQSGICNVEIVKCSPVRAYPRAFTFVSEMDDPAPQRFRLTNIGDGLLDYRIESDQDWLEAFPDQGILGEGESVEITVSVMNHWMPPDTHTGELTVVRQNDHTTVWTPYGSIKRIKSSEVFTIPVTFAVIQPEASCAIASQVSEWSSGGFTTLPVAVD